LARPGVVRDPDAFQLPNAVRVADDVADSHSHSLGVAHPHAIDVPHANPDADAIHDGDDHTHADCYTHYDIDAHAHAVRVSDAGVAASAYLAIRSDEPNPATVPHTILHARVLCRSELDGVRGNARAVGASRGRLFLGL
jgi:hypothetical protein